MESVQVILLTNIPTKILLRNTNLLLPPVYLDSPRVFLSSQDVKESEPRVWKCNKRTHFFHGVLGQTSQQQQRTPYHPFNQRLAFPSTTDKKATQAKWVVVTGRKVVPGSIYRIVIEALGVFQPLDVKAALVHSSEQVSSANTILQPRQLSEILLRVPESSVAGHWQLRVEGHEGVSVVFNKVVDLTFQARFLTILIQPSRPVYNAEQTVHFRAILLTRDLKPYDEPVDCYVLDPRGRIMRRWPSLQTGHGVVHLTFDLPNFPLLGAWTLRVQAMSQIQDKTIMVEHYFRPRFEVYVRLPHTVQTEAEFLEGVIVANMTNWRDVIGNCTIHLQYAIHDHPEHIPQAFSTVYEEYVSYFRGFYGFQLPMDAVQQQLSNLPGSEDRLRQRGVTVRVLAVVGDALGWQIQQGWAMARVVQARAKVAFLGDQPLIFRPAMPITVHAFVTYEDNHPLGEEELEGSVLTIAIRSAGKADDIIVEGDSLVEEEGIAQVTFDLPDNAVSLQVSASLVTGSGLTASATLVGVAQHSPRHRHIQIETSTFDSSPGQFITLHVRNNFFIEYFNYVVLGKGVVLHSGREPVGDLTPPTVTTFSLPASAEMAPAADIVVWVVTQDGQVVSHALAVPVNPLGRHEVSIGWNEHKDHTGGSVEIAYEGEPGSFFGTSAVWEETFLMDAGHDLDAPRILHQMMDMESNNTDLFYGSTNVSVPHMRRAATRSRDGGRSWVNFFPTSLAGPDAPITFNFSELLILTDADLFYHPHHSSDSAPCGKDQVKCLTSGCYYLSERCDGTYQCQDHSDEAGCPVNVDPLRQFRLYRISRLFRFYDPGEGDWGFQDTTGLGNEIQVWEIPKRPQNWVMSIFAVGKELGLGILDYVIPFDSASALMVTLEGPKVARRWEQVGLRACIFNFDVIILGIMVVLPDSDSYRSVLVEEKGHVTAFKPRTTTGERQHLVWLMPGESRDVHFPIVFTRQGEVTITVTGYTTFIKDADTITIDVIPEGADVQQHASVLLDLKSRALAYEFIDIPIDESPIIPYSIRRRYIYDTPRARISVSGDVVGPAFPTVPVGADSLLHLDVMGAEATSFDFAANMWTLHYLRLTNQLDSSLKFEVLTTVNVQYSALVRYQDINGAFRMWIDSEPSVWLTAFAIKSLWLANFQDWENFLYVDPKVINDAVDWLLEYQTPLGSFTETPYFFHPLDNKINPTASRLEEEGYRNVSLTARVVEALETVMPGLQGKTRGRANVAKAAAVLYLEEILETLYDPADVALVAWALTKADSGKKDEAFGLLDSIKREHGSTIYWSREELGFNQVVFENSQKPFTQPKSDQKWDAHAVEASAYALMVYLVREGVGVIQENIVRFLAVMREQDGGLISTQDTIVALEALVEYSYRARLRDVTDMSVILEHSANPNFTVNLHLTGEDNLAELRSFDLENVWGHISVTGHGAGQALVQLEYSYGVDYEPYLRYPKVPSFEFNVSTAYHGRNNSHVTITSCQRWIFTEQANTSGVALLEMYLPSGYVVMQDYLMELVNSRTIRNLRWGFSTGSQVRFYFNYLDTEEICLTYEVERWYPVSNHSRYNMARIQSLYEPEHFNMMILESYPLYDLDVCEVCGSYQCPYCPFYSGAPNTIIFLTRAAPVIILSY
ncbi:hypothetical protein Pmani_008591 [Petrolisthes manimaculis]|uniref:CD109 antigen n=1 Tax=Petrolisthes manimaculis TaxID=1843537 RepID=A0AAE1UJF3_9EUCA|nr:hypothetical protein Pmani_008591 [Petrolisthes manimaculis]